MPLVTPLAKEANLEARLRLELQRWTAVTPAMLHSIDEKGSAGLGQRRLACQTVLYSRRGLGTPFLGFSDRRIPRTCDSQRAVGILSERPLRQYAVPDGLQGRQRDRRAAVGRQQELIPRRGPRCARRHRAAAKVVAWPSGSAARQYTALPDRHGSLRRRKSPKSRTIGRFIAGKSRRCFSCERLELKVHLRPQVPVPRFSLRSCRSFRRFLEADAPHLSFGL